VNRQMPLVARVENFGAIACADLSVRKLIPF
jgi:hypothetical protein